MRDSILIQSRPDGGYVVTVNDAFDDTLTAGEALEVVAAVLMGKKAKIPYVRTVEEWRQAGEARARLSARLAAQPEPDATPPPKMPFQIVDDAPAQIVTEGDGACEYKAPVIGAGAAGAADAERDKLPHDEDWIDFYGGECPVPSGTLVDVQYRGGAIKTALPANRNVPGLDLDAGPAFWSHNGKNLDIVAYRFHKPTHDACDTEGGSQD